MGSDSGAPKCGVISDLIQYAHTNYEENPTEALYALLEALALNGGQESADRAMHRLRTELGDDVADHVGNRRARSQRAKEMIESLLRDESTFLFQHGKQDILRQAMQDGSSVVCTKCNDVINARRWQQHQEYWCPAVQEDGENIDEMDTSG